MSRTCRTTGQNVLFVPGCPLVSGHHVDAISRIQPPDAANGTRNSSVASRMHLEADCRNNIRQYIACALQSLDEKNTKKHPKKNHADTQRVMSPSCGAILWAGGGDWSTGALERGDGVGMEMGDGRWDIGEHRLESTDWKVGRFGEKLGHDETRLGNTAAQLDLPRGEEWVSGTYFGIFALRADCVVSCARGLFRDA